MSEQLLVQLLRETAFVTLLVGAPLLIASLVVGLGVSIFQVVTSIQDMTLTFVPRIVAVFVLGIFLLPWMMEKVMSYTLQLFSQFSMYAR